MTSSPVKRKVFVSYHHRGDQRYYDTFAQTFGGIYDVVEDHSLDREVDSDNVDYVMRVIRQEYITGSSCTIVLCGAQTSGRKHVDMEIKGTLDAEHGLIGMQLPTLPIINNKVSTPERLHDNIETGYAVWIHWEAIIANPAYLSTVIEDANRRDKRLIRNSRPLRLRNA